MASNLLLKPSCGRCGSTSDLYGSSCKHMTLCLACGKTMAANQDKCHDCGSIITRLLREYNVRVSAGKDKNYFIGRFVTGIPGFSKKKNAESKWHLHKEGLQGRPIADALRDKYKNKPWVLEDGACHSQYQAHLEGAQSATYYLLMMHGKEFSAIPVSSWYNFNKVAQYKQLTLEEAEEKMLNRRKTADGYERWMMKSATNGPAAFGEVGKFDDEDMSVGVGRRRKKVNSQEEANVPNKPKVDDDAENPRMNKRGLNKQGTDGDEEGPAGSDLDLDEDDIEKGDDWEHEEIFTDDDEAVEIDPEERDVLGFDVPAPPEIKDDDEDEDNEQGLSKSGIELKKLLKRVSGTNESDAEEEDDDDDTDDDAKTLLLAPKLKGVKEENSDDSPSKPAPGGAAKGTPATKIAKGKRKLNGDSIKTSNGAPLKKIKAENEMKPTVLEESSPNTKVSATPKETPSSSMGPVTEEEIRAVLLQNEPLTTQELVAKFKSRLKMQEDKNAFANILRRISRIQKTNGSNYVVLGTK